MSDRKVWVITAGEYSDYRILGVMDDEAAALDFVEKWNAPRKGRYGSEATAEQFTLNPMLMDTVRQGLDRYDVRMKRDGTAEVDVSDRTLDQEPEADWWEESIKRETFFASVLAKSPEHAVKIVNERRAILIAEGRWPEATEERSTL